MANESLNPLLEALEKHLTTKSVIGDAVTFGDITLIPVMDLMFGAGGGSGEGHDAKNQVGGGSGGGLGARLSPKAVIVIKNGEVQVMAFSKGGAIEKIVEAIPGLLEKFGTLKGQKAASEDGPKPE